MIASTKKWIFRAIKNAEVVFMVVVTGLICLFVFSQVITRYVLHWSVPELEELAIYTMLALVFIGVGLVTRRGVHIRVNLVPLVIHNQRAQSIIGVVIDLIAIIASFYFIFWAYKYMISAWEYPAISFSLGLNLGYIKSLIFGGALLMGGYWVAIGVRDIRALVKRHG